MLELLDESVVEFKKEVVAQILSEVKKKLVVRAGKRVLKNQYNDVQKKAHLKNQFKNKGGLAGAMKSKKISAKKLKKTNRTKGAQIQRKRNKSLAIKGR